MPSDADNDNEIGTNGHLISQGTALYMVRSERREHYFSLQASRGRAHDFLLPYFIHTSYMPHVLITKQQ